MKYSGITKEMSIEFGKLCTNAFFLNFSENLRDIEDDKYEEENIRVVLVDNKMVAGLRLLEYQMNIDGSLLKCGGIGSVSSYPEYRRSGNISYLLENALEEMYTSGYAISYLYPFSHPFYRKYGYEHSNDFFFYTIPSLQLRKYDNKGITRQHVPDTDEDRLQDIFTVYDSYYSNWNLMIKRDYTRWVSLFSDHGHHGDVKTYVHYDQSNNPISYVKYRYKKTAIMDVDCVVLDLAYVDNAALLGILGFLSRLYPYVKNLTIKCPPTLMLQDIIDEPIDIRAYYQHGGMARVINVQKCLLAMRLDASIGSISIAVTDDSIPNNNNTFVLDTAKETVEIATTQSPDMECSIGHLSQLIVGYRDIDALHTSGNVIVHKNIETLRKVFTKRYTHIQDMF